MVSGSLLNEGTSHHVGQAGPTPSPVVAAAAARFPSAPATPLKQNEAYQLPSIEDWQLPSRFQRRPLDEEEIAFINVIFNYKFYKYIDQDLFNKQDSL